MNTRHAIRHAFALACILAASGLLAVSSASAQVNGDWSTNLTGNWSDATKWTSNPSIPDGAGSIVGINSDITVNNLAVTIDTTSRTVGSLTIGDSSNSHGFLLNASGGASLIFNNNGSGATLTETGSVLDTISAPITLADSLGVNTAGTLSLTGEISQTGGARALTKSGAGGLYLANTSNSFSGGVFLNAGTLYTGSNAAAFGTGTLTINGGRIDIGTGPTAAGTTVATTNANTWNASWTIGRASTGDGTWNNNGDILLGATVAVTSANNNTYLNLGGVISDGGNGFGVSFGTNITTLSNANTYTGATTLSAGTLRLSHANALSNSSGVRLTSGTLDLTTNSTIKALTLIGASSTVTGSFNLNFSPGGSILHEDSTGNRAGSITSGITGSPTVTVTAGETLTLNPGSLTQTLGALALNPRQSGTQDNIISLDGTSTGNSIGNITQTTGNNQQRSALTKSGTGTWTVGNLAGAFNSRLRVLPTAGRLIVTGDIYGVQLEMGAGGTLELQKAGNLFTLQGTATTNTITQLRGTIDNTSSGLITFASNPTIALTGDFTHAGNSINMGTGATTLNATRQVTVSTAASTLTLGGIISGATFGITKAGYGTLLLSGANTYTGATTIQAGALVAGTDSLASTTGAFGNASSAIVLGNASTGASDAPSLLIGGAYTVGRNITVGTGATTDFNATIGGSTIANSTFSGDITLASGGDYTTTLQAATGGTVDFTTGTWTTNDKAITIGSSGNAGTVKLSNTLATDGGVAVNYGTLLLGASNRLGDTTPVTVVVDGTFDIAGYSDTVGTVTLAGGNISGTTGVLTSVNNYDVRAGTVSAILGGGVGLAKTTGGTVTLSGNNTYTDGTTVDTGTLALGHASALGSASGSLTVNGGTLNLNDFSPTVGNLTGTGGTIVNNGSGSATLTIGSGNADGGIYGGAIAAGSGTLALTKTGNGTITLSGNNTYTGATTVTGGTLEVAGSGSINSSSGITVNAGGALLYNSSTALTKAPDLAGTGTGAGQRAVLGGSGPINVAVTLDSVWDVLSPGNSPGIQTYLTSQTWASFSYDWETNDFTGTGVGDDFDQIQITGSLELTGDATNSYFLNLLSLTALDEAGFVPNFSETTTSWDILTTTGGITGFNADYWIITTGGFTSSPDWLGNWSLSATSNSLVLTYTKIPEPSTMILAGLGLAGLTLRRRRK